MKKIITKSLTIITVIAMALTLALPVQAEAKAKVKLNRTKATLTITDTKSNPAVRLKVTGTSKKATWTTSNKTVAAVSQTGKVIARKKGAAVITAKVSGKKYTCKVTVADKRVKLNRTKATLTITDTKANPAVQLKVTGTSKKVTWTTSNKTVAAVSQTGKVTARKKGTAVITAKVNRKSYKCRVTVKGTHKHHWAPHYDIGIENIEGYVCACGKVFTSGEDWRKHSTDELLKHINDGEGTGEHASWSGGKTIYITWIWHYDCDTCGFHDYDYKYPHPVKAAICSGCKKEFKDYDEWHKHFMENSLNGDDSHRKCTVVLKQ